MLRLKLSFRLFSSTVLNLENKTQEFSKKFNLYSDTVDSVLSCTPLKIMGSFAFVLKI